MIFITVGTQLPFERMLTYVSQWLEKSGYTGNVVAQVGEESGFESDRMVVYKTLSNNQYYHWFSQAEVIVSHAGMGTILSCLDSRKRGVFLPREFAYSEHRNDHQLDTANAFANQYPSLRFCFDRSAFHAALDACVAQAADSIPVVSGDTASDNALGQRIGAYLGLRSINE
ncbi:glycosyltransferase [Halomonas alkaliantarctica]|uniref:glycosyltransferase n=1 Tax=Halomonas alkaliantarctica TaxID=232346 RepID=UPI0004AB9EDE|nr:glycosyltransferase [Halomonas alkaliantarctica]